MGGEAVGSVEVTTVPALSTATQSDGDWQETPRKASSSFTPVTVQVGGEAVGFVEVRTLPFLSTATHNEVDWQETPSR